MDANADSGFQFAFLLFSLNSGESSYAFNETTHHDDGVVPNAVAANLCHNRFH